MKAFLDYLKMLLGLGPSQPGTALTTVDEVVRLRDEKVEAGPTVVFLKRHSHVMGTKLGESKVEYDPWGVPSAREPAFGDRVELRPNGRSADDRCEWKYKSGPEIRFPTDKERNSFFPPGR